MHVTEPLGGRRVHAALCVYGLACTSHHLPFSSLSFPALFALRVCGQFQISPRKGQLVNPSTRLHLLNLRSLSSLLSRPQLRQKPRLFLFPRAYHEWSFCLKEPLSALGSLVERI